MSDNKRKKLEPLPTPKGIGRWLFIHKAQPKYKKPEETEFSAQIVLTKQDALPIVKKLTDIAERARQEAIAEATKPKDKKAISEYQLSLPINPEEDDDGNETGNYVLKAKQNEFIVGKGGKQRMKIAVVDAQLKPTKANPGTGSTIRLKTDIVPFVMPATEKVGVSLRLKAVQIIDLVAYGGADDISGFDKEDGFTDPGEDSEDGFEAEEGVEEPAGGKADF